MLWIISGRVKRVNRVCLSGTNSHSTSYIIIEETKHIFTHHKLFREKPTIVLDVCVDQLPASKKTTGLSTSAGQLCAAHRVGLCPWPQCCPSVRKQTAPWRC